MKAALHGWRTRLFHLSRSPRVVGFTSIAILAVGFALSLLIVAIKGNNEPSLEQAFASQLKGIQTPRQLALWLHDLTSDRLTIADELESELPTLESFTKTGSIFHQPVRQAIRDHAGPQDQQALFTDYIIARLEPKSEPGKAAWERLKAAALRLPPPPIANEFLGDLLDDADMPMEAISAYRREGVLPEALQARDRAWALAIKHKEKHTLQELLADATYRSELSAWHEHEVGAVLEVPWLRLRGLVRMEWQSLEWDRVLCTALAAALWCAVLLRFLPAMRWRWAWTLPPIVLGVISVVPTLWIVHYQTHVVGLVENGNPIHDAVFFLLGVGLREELSKLALFAFLLPMLLKQRSEAAAQIAGALVGLGFALEENLQYYAEGFAAVVGRLLTANFMHIAMTAITGHALYVMVRSRFHRVQQFLATFGAIVAAHAFYDWAIGAESAHQLLGGLSMASVVVLALLAQRFFDSLLALARPQRGLVSMVALFVLGTVSLISLAMVLEALSTGALTAISSVGADALSNAVILVFYVRKLADF